MIGHMNCMRSIYLVFVSRLKKYNHFAHFFIGGKKGGGGGGGSYGAPAQNSGYGAPKPSYGSGGGQGGGGGGLFNGLPGLGGKKL